MTSEHDLRPSCLSSAMPLRSVQAHHAPQAGWVEEAVIG